MLLNGDGEQLLARMSPALDALGEAIEQVTGEADIMRLKLGVLPLYASRQLIHRLPGLRAQHPNLHLDIDTAAHAMARLGEGLTRRSCSRARSSRRSTGAGWGATAS